MSTVAAVKAYPMLGPAPLAPRHSLLSMALGIDTEQWVRGAAVEPYPPGTPVGFDQCLEGSMGVKDDPEGILLSDEFRSFMAYLGDICTARSIGEEWPAWQAKTNRAFQMRRSWTLERQLMNGTFATAPYMGDSDLNVVAGALPAAVAIAQLEAIGAATGQEYWLHVPPEVASFVGYNQLSDDRGVLRTATGAPVVVGHGYSQDGHEPNANTDTPARPQGEPPLGEAAAGAQQSWIYVTGPVMARVADTVFLNPETMSEARDWAQNTVVYRAEQLMVVAWDKQLQGAALADWSGS